MKIADEITELRRRAQWYRDFADVGSADNKELRLSLARHFDRRADELERERGNGKTD
jgi:hypothetical protein